MKARSLFPTEETLAINTDLYELTMAAAYFEAGCTEDRATFELFAPRLPTSRRFLITVGLEQSLHLLENVCFTENTIRFLQSLDPFKSVNSAFFDYLRDFRFTGDVYALPEGTVCFANEPVLQVCAPIIESQIMETYLINTFNFQTMVASKAARVCLAGEGKSIIDFGSRRAHSPQAGVLAARSAFIGGCAGTSNVLAGYEMGIPLYGTMAHSYVQFFDSETEAFQNFYQIFGKDSTILVDTYNTLAGVKKALALGGPIQGVRLDSGDLLTLACRTRELLDKHGQSKTRIVASGELDEKKISSFARAGAPIDAYGVGTNLVVSSDAPGCDLVYKLVEVVKEGEARPKLKTSTGKATLPYRKQVFRCSKQNYFSHDWIGRWNENPSSQGNRFDPLLHQYVAQGELVANVPDLVQTRDYAQEQLRWLPDSIKLLDDTTEYPVEISPELLRTHKKSDEEFIRC